MLDLFATDWREIWQGVDNAERVGAIYTRPEIVSLILDLAEYKSGAGRLASRRLLEPSCGDGAFLAAILQRLIESELQHSAAVNWNDTVLESAICAVDISESAVDAARTLIRTSLVQAGCPPSRAGGLAERWAIQADFLLEPWEERFSLVVGNPPYVRLEDLPKRALVEYRRRFLTLTDRADLYVAFFECGLRLLDDDGVLAFICANRFAKNQYGAALRRLVTANYRVQHYINLEHTQPFLQDVSAYPAIIVVDRHKGRETQAGTLTELGSATLDAIRLQSVEPSTEEGPLASFSQWYPKGSPWITTSPEEYQVFQTLDAAFPLLEESGGLTRVGIGVATGADEVFVLPEASPTIESSRQIPLLMAGDVSSDRVTWSGHFLLNPFDDLDDGSLVALDQYPGLAAHFATHAGPLRGRHVAKNRPNAWYRTIDRIWPRLQEVPKLVIPDIQRGSVIGLDAGLYYPHHNLYWISSDAWDLSALQGLLRSSLALIQVRALSVQMRGGSVRYQAQTLRRVRIPELRRLSSTTIDSLRAAATSTDQAEIDAAANDAFGVHGQTIRAA